MKENFYLINLIWQMEDLVGKFDSYHDLNQQIIDDRYSIDTEYNRRSHCYDLILLDSGSEIARDRVKDLVDRANSAYDIDKTKLEEVINNVI
jgi:hypothetical protein